MPSHYAHYRFGSQLIETLPPEIRSRIHRFRQLYDVGLQGPDIFLYHNIFWKDSTVSLSGEYHSQTGTEFFPGICQHLHRVSSEGGLVYLYGLLAHYCLDSTCHPFVQESTEDGSVGHIELETEFDRFLLFQDGHRQPQVYDGSHYLKLTPGECETVAEFYGPATAASVRQSIRNMAAAVRFLASPPGLGRSLVNLSMKITAGKFTPHVMGRSPNKNCAHLNEPLERLYTDALAKYPFMLQQLTDHLYSAAPLGEDFEKPFC